MRATGARIGGLPPLTLTATLRDVHVAHLTSLQGAIGRLRVDARLAPRAVRDMVDTPACLGSLPPGVRDALTSAPRVLIFPGRIDLLPPSGRATEVRLRPAATRRAVVLEPSGVEQDGCIRAAARSRSARGADRAARARCRTCRSGCRSSRRSAQRGALARVRRHRRNLLGAWLSRPARATGVASVYGAIAAAEALPSARCSRPRASAAPASTARARGRQRPRRRAAPARRAAAACASRGTGSPGLAVLAGIVAMSFGTATSLLGGAALIGAGLAIWLVAWLYRVGIEGDATRDAEERARRIFDRTGRWPEA